MLKRLIFCFLILFLVSGFLFSQNRQSTLDNVKKLFEDNRWKVGVKYESDNISFNAENGSDFFIAYFAYRNEDMKHAPVMLDSRGERDINQEKIAKYQSDWGAKVNYHGSPAAVQLYERTFGVSSAADDQVFIRNGKTISAVEAAFKAEGYSVELYPTDKGTARETWQINCMKISPHEVLVAGYGYSPEWARSIGESSSNAGAAYNTTIKYEDNFFYYGTPNAEHLFQCIGRDGKVDMAKFAVKPAVAEPGKPQAVTAIENAFKTAGFETVMSIQIGKGTDTEYWQITCVKVSPYDLVIIAYGPSSEWATTTGTAAASAATAYNSTVKYRGNAYYFGTPNAEKIFETVRF